MPNVNNTKNEDYEYEKIMVIDLEGNCCDYSVDELLDDALEDVGEDQIAYLNKIIRDIEHYRDNL